MKTLISTLALTLTMQAANAGEMDLASFVSQKAAEYQVVKSNPYVQMVASEQKNQSKLLQDLQKIYNENKNRTANQLERSIVAYNAARILTCRIADVAIIVNGVMEGAPVASYAARYLGKTNEFETEEIESQTTNTEALLGGALNSVWPVVIEVVSSYDSSRIEFEIAKYFPATNIIARKVKGDTSACYKNTLIVDMLKELQKTAK